MNRRGFFKWFGAVAAVPVAAKMAEAVVKAAPMTEALEPPPAPSIKPAEPVVSSVAWAGPVRQGPVVTQPDRAILLSRESRDDWSVAWSVSTGPAPQPLCSSSSTPITSSDSMLNCVRWDSTGL